MITKKEYEMARLLSLFLLCTVLFSGLLKAEDPKYKLGQGVQLGTLPLYLGGYFSLLYRDTFDNERLFELENVALMLYGEKENFSYMLELEAENVYSEVFQNEDADVVNEHFHIERLYLEYAFNESYALRAGKFNSPVGLWNQIPINVLRDTSSNPMHSRMLFPQFTSGLDVKYTANTENEMSVDILLQENEDFDNLISKEIYNNFETDRHYGIGLSLTEHAVSYHLNAGVFRTVTADEYYYLSAAFLYDMGDLRLQAEVGTQFDQDKNTIPYVGYIQGRYTFEEKHEAIVRLESYDDRSTEAKDTFAVLGYTYRPLYPIALKGEYQWHTLHDEDRVMFSLSILF